MTITPSCPTVLTIAGSDPCAGAGIQADLKTVTALGGYAVTVLTALTAQSTVGVDGIHAVPPFFVRQQLDTLLADVTVDAVKVGMLGSAAVTEVVSEALGCAALQGVPVVVDPVMVSTSGARLLDDEAQTTLLALMRQHADLITPNLPEAQHIVQSAQLPEPDDQAGLAQALRGLGIDRVLVKGGHAAGRTEAVDVLVDETGTTHLAAPWITTRSTHGTGCTLSSAIATERVRHRSWADAVRAAKAWTTEAIRHADELEVGRGHGPLHHDWERGTL